MHVQSYVFALRVIHPQKFQQTMEILLLKNFTVVNY